MRSEGAPSALEVVYESPQVTVAHRCAVALGTGVATTASMAFLRWGCHGAGPAALDHASVGAGALVFAGLVVAAFRSRTAWRVRLDRSLGELRVDRDPGVCDAYPLRDLTSVDTEAVAGGWSRDPAEVLVLRLSDGRVHRVRLPDDALTTGIADDIRGAISSLEGVHDGAKDAPVGVARAGEVAEHRVEGAALGAVAIAEAPRDDAGRRG